MERDQSGRSSSTNHSLVKRSYEGAKAEVRD
jgi:hypothetical protein